MAHNDNPGEWWSAEAKAEAEAAAALKAEKASKPAAKELAQVEKPAEAAGSDIDAQLDADARAKAEQLRKLGASDDEIERQVGRLAPPRPSKADVDRQLADLNELRRTNPKLYWGEETQAEHRRLIELQQQLQSSKAKPTTESAEDDPGAIAEGLGLREEWAKSGGVERNLKEARATAEVVLGALDPADAEQIEQSFNALPLEIQIEAFRHMALPEGGIARTMPEESVKAFAAIDPSAAALVKAWGLKAGERLAQAYGKMELGLANLDEKHAAAAHKWLGDLPSKQRVAIVRAMSK
jgi:hypothetical protein